MEYVAKLEKLEPELIRAEIQICSVCGPKFCSYKITQKIVKEHGQAILDIAN